MAIEDATFVVQRGDNQLSCLGSELEVKLLDDDLLIAQRGDTHGSIVKANIQDTDLFVVTDGDNGHKSVTGIQVKDLISDEPDVFPPTAYWQGIYVYRNTPKSRSSDDETSTFDAPKYIPQPGEWAWKKHRDGWEEEDFVCHIQTADMFQPGIPDVDKKSIMTVKSESNPTRCFATFYLDDDADDKGSYFVLEIDELIASRGSPVVGDRYIVYTEVA